MPTFAVITRVPDASKGESGNLACVLDLYVPDQEPSEENGWLGTVKPLAELVEGGMMTVLQFRTPVFELGEILIIDGEYGREVCGAERKPSKWDVDVEHFDDLTDAIKRAQELRR